MLAPANVPDVDPQELLARYVFSRSHVQRQAQRVKAAAFMPPPDLEMSVTRHRDASEDEIWAAGQDIGIVSARTLYGRGDAMATAYIGQRLSVVVASIEGNPNHAHVTGWPLDEAAQKLIAQEIAAVAKFVAFAEA